MSVDLMPALRASLCRHPADAISTLKDGVTRMCTACQTVLNMPIAGPAPAWTPVDEPAEADDAPVMPPRLWGDEPDPIPQSPTVLVASTDPYIHQDGDAARQYAPKPALTAAKDAFAGGWRHEFTYAAAAVPERGEAGKRGHKPAHVVHTIALRLARDTTLADSIETPGGMLLGERGYAIWAREDTIADPSVEGKWAWVSADINGRPYGARELRPRLLRQGRALLDDPPLGTEPATPVRAELPPTPLAPIVPGSWGSLHTGDVVTGGDGRPYTVESVHRTGVWIGAGQPEVRVTLRYPDGSGTTTVNRSAAERAAIAELGDTSEAAAVLGATFTINEETTAVQADQFSEPAAPVPSGKRQEPPMGRYHWYKLAHPVTGYVEAIWPRVSTIMKTHADSEGLADWKIRMAMKGLSISPDLIAMVASLDIEADKGKFHEAAEQASNRASSKSGANFGTAVDRFTDRLDSGESIASMGVPEGLRADVEAYAAALRDHGLEAIPELSQRTTLNVTHEYAGTWDRVVRRIATGELFMLDVKRTKPDAKSGRMSSYSWLEYSSQLAAYVNGEYMCSLDFTGYEPMPDVSKTKALLLHIVPGKGRGELYGVRVEHGWRNFTRSIETRRDRSAAKGSEWSWLIERPAASAPAAPATQPTTVAGINGEPIPALNIGTTVTPPASALAALVEAETPTTPPVVAGVHELVARDIAAAGSVERLGEIATNAIGAGVWTDELGALALGRDDQIRAFTAADHAALGALWTELTPLGRWTAEVAAHADARAAELAALVSV